MVLLVVRVFALEPGHIYRLCFDRKSCGGLLRLEKTLEPVIIIKNSVSRREVYCVKRREIRKSSRGLSRVTTGQEEGRREVYRV